MSSLSDRLQSLQQRRIETLAKIDSNRSQLSSMSAMLNNLANRKKTLGTELTNLQQTKAAILSLLK